MKDERLIVLLDAYLDGALTPDEKAELERMLLESAAARKEFWMRTSLHGWSYAAAKLHYGARAIPGLEKKTWWQLTRAFIFDTWQQVQRLRRWSRPFAIASACAIVALLAVFAWRQNSSRFTAASNHSLSTTNGVAKLIHSAGVVWAATNDLDIGASLSKGWLRLKSGALQIEFNSGAQAILEGPAALELVSTGEANLEFGKLSAVVPPPAHGFKVHAGAITVTDLGTEFGIDRPLEKPPEVQVFVGQVQVERTAPAEKSEANNQKPASLILKAGEGIVAEANALQPITLQRTNFLSLEELMHRETVELRTHFALWRQANRALDNDPSLLVHFNFQDTRAANGYLMNRAANAQPGTHGLIVGCDWTEGRWAGKGALDFKDASDQVRFAVPGEYESLTYIAWVRVDQLANSWNSLALTQRAQPGEVHWQFLRDGQMVLSVHHGSGDEERGWESVLSSPVITPAHTDRWMQVAAVYDGPGRLMSVYVNGQLAGSKKISTPLKLVLGTIALGNWNPLASGSSAMRARLQRKDFNFLVRNFRGRMDEFALFSRPLTVEEIRRQYELGCPRDSVIMAGLPTAEAADQP